MNMTVLCTFLAGRVMAGATKIARRLPRPSGLPLSHQPKINCLISIIFSGNVAQSEMVEVQPKRIRNRRTDNLYINLPPLEKVEVQRTDNLYRSSILQ